MADETSLEPHRRRPPILSIVVAAGSLYLLWALREETVYFFRSRTPRDLQARDAAALTMHNAFVRVQGVPDRQRTVILDGRWGRHRGVFRMHGSRSRLFVSQPRKHRMPPDVFSDVFEGRLLRMADQDYFPELYRFYADQITIPVELAPAELLRLAGRAPVDLRDRDGEPFRLEAKDDLFFGVTFPGELRVQFDRARYPKPEESEAVLATLGVPWGPLEDSGAFRSYVVHADGEQADALLARFRDISQKVGVLPRAAAVRCRWGDARRAGDALRLLAQDEPAPAPFVAANGRLQPASPEKSLTVPLSRIRSVEVQAPLRIPRDAMLLREGDLPGTYWYIAAADALLLAFVAINLMVLLRRWRGATA